METIKATQHFCWECGNDVHQLPGRRLKKFCCSECRTKWWNRQRRAERAASPRAEDAHVCQHCGTVFFAYGQNARKYCSHECYIAARFGDKNPADTSCRKPDGKDIECGPVTEHEPDGLPEVAPMEPVMIDISIYAGNPYAKKATTERIELDESFFVAAYPLLEAGIDKVLSAFGMDPAHFSAQEKTYIIGRLYRMENSPVKDTLPLDIDDCTVRIMAARISAMEELVEEKLRGIGARIREMTPPERKEICRMIHSLPKDPGGVFTTGHMLSLAGISRNSYYCYIGKDDYGLTVSARDAIAEEAVRRAFEYKGYKKGVRMVYMLIPRLTGRKIGMDRVRRIMREYGMDCGVRKANSSRQAAAKRLAEYGKPNLLKRMFRLHRPNEVRITDVTYLKYSDDLEAYGSALMDPVTGVLVAFVVSDHNDLELAKETLRRSDSHPCRDGGTFHSDQGSVYLSPEFQEEVKKLGFKQSMSKRGNCWDNAPQESFFGHFKDECDYSGCKDLDELKAVIDGYSYYYNNERGLWDRKKMTPVQYEAYLLSLTDNEFVEYMAREEKKYNDMKAEAAKRRKSVLTRLEYNGGGIGMERTVMDNAAAAMTDGVMSYAGHRYVRLVAKNGDLYYTDDFYSAMYEKITRDGMNYVEAYNALGFDTSVLTEARANCAGARAVKKMANKKFFEKNPADYDSDTSFEEMIKKCARGEMSRDDLYANMAARLIVLETMNNTLKKTKQSGPEKKK